MIELHLIGYTSDLRWLVLDLEPDGERGRYRLLIDGDLLLTLDELRDLRAQAGLDVGVPYERLEERLGITIARSGPEGGAERRPAWGASDDRWTQAAAGREGPRSAEPPPDRPSGLRVIRAAPADAEEEEKKEEEKDGPSPDAADGQAATPDPDRDATVELDGPGAVEPGPEGPEEPAAADGAPEEPPAVRERPEEDEEPAATDQEPDEPPTTVERPDGPPADDRRVEPGDDLEEEVLDDGEPTGDDGVRPDASGDRGEPGPAASDERPTAAEPEEPGPVDSRLSPAEIQTRLRGGRTPESVAEEAGTDVSWVERWLPPILTERAQVLGEARSMHLVHRRKGRSRLPLGEAVAANLRRRKLDPEEDATWSVKRRVDGRWSINVRYRYRGRTRSATWALERGEGELTPSSDAARQLGWTERS